MYHIIAIFTVCIWGTTFVSTKVLLHAGLTPSGIFLVRFVLAYIGMALACRKGWRCASWRDECLMVLAGMSGGSFYFLTENTALEYALAGTVSFIVCTAPVGTALLYAVWHRRSSARLPRRLWVGMAVSLVGVALVAGGDASEMAAHPVLGGCLALCAAFSWAVYQNIVKPLGCRYGASVLTRKVFGYGLLTIVVYEAVAGCFSGQYALSAVVHNTAAVLSEPMVWGNLLFLGLVASLACYFVWNKVVEKLGAVVSANYIYLNPLTTCLFSALFLGESFDFSMCVGGVAILVGV